MILSYYPLTADFSTSEQVPSSMGYISQLFIDNKDNNDFSDGLHITDSIELTCGIKTDSNGNYVGSLRATNVWEINIDLNFDQNPDGIDLITIENDMSSEANNTIIITTNKQSTASNAIKVDSTKLYSGWKTLVIRSTVTSTEVYVNAEKCGSLSYSIIFPGKTYPHFGGFYQADGNFSLIYRNGFRAKNLKLYYDENTDIGTITKPPDESVSYPSPPDLPKTNLVANFPLQANGNNTVTGIDAARDLNITSSFTGNYNSGVFYGNTAVINMNRPYVDNYTNKYLGMPWEIDFQIYYPDCKDNITLITIFNPSSNANKNRTLTVTTNTNPSNPYEICVPKELFMDGWVDCKIQCTGTGGELAFYLTGQQYGNIVRGFLLTSDLGTNPTVITFVNNNTSYYLSNILIYLDATTETHRGYSEYFMDLGFIVKRAVLQNTPLVVDIPFPYPQFTEMEFFLTDNFGNFIPSSYYERLDENRLYFNSTSVTSLNISDVEEIRFTFVHNRGMYAINKLEFNTKTVAGKYDYELPSPYLKLLDLNMRYRVFYDRKLLIGDQAYEYKIDKYTGIISFDREDFTIEPDKNLDILIFYDGTKYNGAIPYLPMSGYIYFKKHEIDRNYNKDLCCFFVNGRLVHRDNIIKMSNNVYKISKDIQSRYNLEAFSMSPKISELIPFYKKAGRKNTIPDQYIYKEMEVIFTVPRDNYGQKHNRKKLKPVTFNIITVPHYVLPNHKDWYITLVQHGVDEGEFYQDRQISYSAEFFRDDYINISEDINVIGQIRLQGNFEEHTPDSPTALLLGTIPKRVTTCISDTVIFSVKAQAIYDADTTNHNKDIDGVLVRFEIEPFLKKHERPSIYYEMECTEYEKDNYINVFELLVTDQANGEGQEYYKKVINMFPDNNPYENR